jgi:hypothetical protein
MVRFAKEAGGLALAIGAAAAAAGSVMSPVSQVREVQTEARVDIDESSFDDFDFVSAPGFGAFSSSIDAIASGGVLDDATALADQGSTLSSTLVSGSGSATTLADPNSLGLVLADARSYLEYEFTIAASTDYELDGLLVADELFTGEGAAWVELSGPGGTIFSALQNTAGPQPFSNSGTFAPGTYTLRLEASAHIEGLEDEGLGAWEVSLVVPEPGTGLAVGLMVLAVRGRRRS